MDVWTEIPAAMSSGTYVYCYDQVTDISVPTPWYKRLPQSQQTRPRLDGGPQFRLSGPEQNGRPASSSGAVIPAAIAEQSNVYGYDQPWEPPPPYEEPLSSSSPAPQPLSMSLARQHPDCDLIRSWSEVVVEPRVRSEPAKEPNAYLCLSAVVFLFFCWPLGLIALIFSQQAKKAIDQADYAKARMFSKQAFRTSMIGIVAGLSLVAVSVIVYVNMFQQESATTDLTTRSSNFHF